MYLIRLGSSIAMTLTLERWRTWSPRRASTSLRTSKARSIGRSSAFQPITERCCDIWSLRVYNFNNVSSLTMYIPENFGADNTTISYIGLKGEFAAVRSLDYIGNFLFWLTFSWNVRRWWRIMRFGRKRPRTTRQLNRKWTARCIDLRTALGQECLKSVKWLGNVSAFYCSIAGTVEWRRTKLRRSM